MCVMIKIKKLLKGSINVNYIKKLSIKIKFQQKKPYESVFSEHEFLKHNRSFHHFQQSSTAEACRVTQHIDRTT